MPQILNLTKSFDGKTVLQNFSTSWEKGEHLCLMGPSGSGKTTLMRLICGLEMPDSGSNDIPADTRFSVVFQEDRLLQGMTAVGNVALTSPAPIAEIRQNLLILGLPQDSLSKPVSTFSGGMKRRVALCRALMTPSDILLLDEPYKGLDEATKLTAMHEVERLANGRTIILITHDPDEAVGYRVIHLGTD